MCAPACARLLIRSVVISQPLYQLSVLSLLSRTHISYGYRTPLHCRLPHTNLTRSCKPSVHYALLSAPYASFGQLDLVSARYFRRTSATTALFASNISLYVGAISCSGRERHARRHRCSRRLRSLSSTSAIILLRTRLQ
jgi:hypothetical protein